MLEKVLGVCGVHGTAPSNKESKCAAPNGTQPELRRQSARLTTAGIYQAVVQYVQVCSTGYACCFAQPSSQQLPP
jgi:hypothetical protein